MTTTIESNAVITIIKQDIAEYATNTKLTRREASRISGEISLAYKIGIIDWATESTLSAELLKAEHKHIHREAIEDFKSKKL